MYENLPRVGVVYALQCGPLNWKREGGDDEKDAELTMEDGELKLTGGRCLLVDISVDDGGRGETLVEDLIEVLFYLIPRISYAIIELYL